MRAWPGDDVIGVETRQFSLEEDAAAAVAQVRQDRIPVLIHENAHERFYRMVPSSVALPRRDAEVERCLHEFLGISLHAVPDYCRFVRSQHGGPLFLRSLSHSWALWGWARWLHMRKPTVGRPCIIHVDYHDDLGPPPLLTSPDREVFASPLGASGLDLTRPATVASAVRRGLVGIGSFMVPILSALDACDVVHLIPERAARSSGRAVRLHVTAKPYDWFCGSGLRPEVALLDNPAAQGRVVGNYLVTDEPELLSSLSVRGPVLLDIDMDYFCNAYDDRSDEPPEHRYRSTADVCDLIDGVADHLAAGTLARRIEVVTIALSPGFFPSTYWRAAVPRLERRLAELTRSTPLRKTRPHAVPHTPP